MKASFETISCNYCHASDEDFISSKGQFDLPVNVVICKNCGLSYLNPRWTKATYLDFYTNHYDKYYRPGLNNEDHLKEPNPIFDRLQKRKLSPAPKNILDVGSGAGGNLRYLQRKFPKSNFYAIEPSTDAQEVLRDNNIAIITDDADSEWDKTRKNTFDLIIMRHVLEHFSDPSAILRKVANCLNDNGVLYIAVPNSLKPTAPLQTHGFRVVHTYYFNQYTLFNLLVANGLAPIEMVEGDHFSPGELYTFAKKGNGLAAKDQKEAYNKQKAIYDKKLSEENKLWPSFRRQVQLFREKLKRSVL